MERKVLIAIALSIVVVTAYSAYMQKYYPAQTHQQLPEAQSPKQTETVSAPGAEIGKGQTVSLPYHNSITTVSFDTTPYHLVFSSLGGGIKSVKLKEFTGSSSNEPILLFDIENAEEFPTSLFIDGQNLVNYKTEKGDGWVKFSYSFGQQLVITKKFKLKQDDYSIDLEIVLENLTGADLIKNYDLVVGSRINKSNKLETRFVASNFYSRQNGILWENAGKVRQKRIAHPGEFEWAAQENQYFCIIAKPFHKTKAVFSNGLSDSELQTGLTIDDFTIPAKSKAIHKYLIYIGPKDMKLLAAQNQNFEKIFYYGTFTGISKILLSCMRFLYKLTHNYGVAIIMLSLLINLVLFPFTYKSLSSMKKMQAIQPKLNEIRKLYKDNPQKLHKEMMELYKREKINPLGGCLPLFFQFPIFYALFRALEKAVELKNANFLWINDLSGPDKTFILYKLQKEIPIMGNAISINVLPLLMIGAMAFQQKMSAPGKTGDPQQDQQQKMMLVMFPLMFGLLFYNFYSGLVLYWFTNSLIMMIYQWKIKVGAS